MLRLKLLGEFELRDCAGRPLTVRARKNRALLAALALAPAASMPRKRVAGLLWSDRSDAQAQGSLRQALLALRQDLAAADLSLLAAKNDRVTLDPTRIEVDAVVFQRLAASDDVDTLRRAAALYRGELLADTDISDPAYEEWVGAERRRLSELAIKVLEKLCALESGGARIDVAQRLVALDPFREASHRTLMRAYADACERTLALRQYEICRDMLKDEFQAVPQQDTEALHQRLRNAIEHAKKGDGTSIIAASPGAWPTSDDKPSIAVLPFDVLGDAELENLAGGLTENIITGLSRISAIRVIAHNTMLAYKRRAIDIRSVGREIEAQYVLEGTVRSSGTRLRASAQLIEAASGHHIWAEQTDHVRAEVFDLQDDMTRSIVSSVQTQLILHTGKLFAASNDPTEHAAWLLARSWQRFLSLTAESLAESRALAERALELDGKRGMAHRMLAVSTYHQVYMGFLPWTEQSIDALYAHANASIACEDADEYCHWAMTCANLLKRQHERAVASLRRALEINPNCSLVHGSMGTVLAWSGQSDASISCNKLALRINPQDPSNFFRHFGLALAHYLAARYDKAIEHASMVVQVRPLWWLGQIVYSASLAQLGRDGEAFHAFDELKLIRPCMNAASLGVLPFSNACDREHLLDGLHRAGLPD